MPPPRGAARLLAVGSAAAALAAAAGQTCAPPGCPAGTPCTVADRDRCASARCLLNLTNLAYTCAAPTCADNLQNQWETGIDCGGECLGCGDGGSCYAGEDCRSGLCTFPYRTYPWVELGAMGGTCRPSDCQDGVANGMEVDIDCGLAGCCADYQDPSECPFQCGDGYRCFSTQDCKSGRCFRDDKTGNKFCAALRVTDTQPELSSIVGGGVTLSGLRRWQFPAADFRAAVAFMLDCPLDTVVIDTLVDVPMPREYGNESYLDIRRSKGWEPAAVRRLWQHGGRAAQAWTVIDRYNISTTDTVMALNVRYLVYTAPYEVELIAERAQQLLQLELPAAGGWATVRQQQLAALQHAADVEYCETYFANLTASPENVTDVDCALYLAANGSETGYANASVPSTDDGTNDDGGDRVTFYDALAQRGIHAAAITQLDNATVSADADPPDDVRMPALLWVVQDPRGVPGQPVYAGRPFPIQPQVAVLDRHARPVTELPAALSSLTITAAVNAGSVTAAGQGGMQLGGTRTRAPDANGTVEYNDLLVTAPAPQVTLTFTANFTAASGDPVSLTATTRPFAVYPAPPAPVIVHVHVPMHPAAVVALTVAAAAVGGALLLAAPRWLLQLRTPLARVELEPPAVKASRAHSRPGRDDDDIMRPHFHDTVPALQTRQVDAEEVSVVSEPQPVYEEPPLPHLTVADLPGVPTWVSAAFSTLHAQLAGVDGEVTPASRRPSDAAPQDVEPVAGETPRAGTAAGGTEAGTETM